jgi:hypothetical protein
METGSIKKVLTLLAGILAAFLVADALSNAVVVLFHPGGAVGMAVSIVVYAVLFFTMLHLIEKYTHIVFFRFDRD